MNYCETLRCAELCTGKTCKKCSPLSLCFVVEDPDTAKFVVILAAIAARASKRMVFLLIDKSIQRKLDWIEAYLELTFGTCNWWLRLSICNDTMRTRDYDSYFYISADPYSNLLIDPEMAQTTLLPHSTKILGPVHLDQDLHLQDANFDAFRDRNQSKKIIAFCGTESTTFPIQAILRFLNDNKEWAAVFMGKDADKLLTADFPYYLVDKLCVVAQTKLEVLTRSVNVLVSNPDAASITIGMAAGIPQICAWKASIYERDDEWETNNICVSKELKLGPSFIVNHTPVPFKMAMGDLVRNWDLYMENVKRVQHQVKNEHSAMKANMSEFFKELSVSVDLQNFVRREGIPAKFLLE
jgi:hypothetical protein